MESAQASSTEGGLVASKSKCWICRKATDQLQELPCGDRICGCCVQKHGAFLEKHGAFLESISSKPTCDICGKATDQLQWHSCGVGVCGGCCVQYILTQETVEEACAVLGVAWDASWEAIETAFRQRARDVHSDNPEAAAIQRLTESTILLFEAGVRRNWDRGLFSIPMDPDSVETTRDVLRKALIEQMSAQSSTSQVSILEANVETHEPNPSNTHTVSSDSPCGLSLSAFTGERLCCRHGRGQGGCVHGSAAELLNLSGRDRPVAGASMRPWILWILPSETRPDLPRATRAERVHARSCIRR